MIPSKTRHRIPLHGRGLLSAVVAVYLLLVSSSPAGAQPRDPGPGGGGAPIDYFAPRLTEETTLMIKNLELYHLGDIAFWRPYRSGDYVGARTSVEYVLRYVPNHPVALHLGTLLGRSVGDTNYPVALFERALRFCPDRPVTLAQYGEYLMSIGFTQAGRRYLSEALQRDPNLLMAQAWILAPAPPSVPAPTPAPR